MAGRKAGRIFPVSASDKIGTTVGGESASPRYQLPKDWEHFPWLHQPYPNPESRLHTLRTPRKPGSPKCPCRSKRKTTRCNVRFPQSLKCLCMVQRILFTKPGGLGRAPIPWCHHCSAAAAAGSFHSPGPRPCPCRTGGRAIRGRPPAPSPAPAQADGHIRRAPV